MYNEAYAFKSVTYLSCIQDKVKKAKIKMGQRNAQINWVNI